MWNSYVYPCLTLNEEVKRLYISCFKSQDDKGNNAHIHIGKEDNNTVQNVSFIYIFSWYDYTTKNVQSLFKNILCTISKTVL